MKNLILICLVGFFFVQVQAQTNVAGTIANDSTWSVAGSPYIVTSSLTISHGVTLNVESGVTVKFDNSQYLYVNGTLNAAGAIFTSSKGSPISGDWGYIQVGSWSVSDSGNVILNSCQIQYATRLYVCNGKATLTNTDLTNFSNYGVYVEALGTLNMTGGNINTNSSWASSNGNGISTNPNAHAAISGVTIQNFQNGISLQSNAAVNISNINITNCNWPIIYDASADLTASGTNSFVGNTNTAVFMNLYSFSDTLTLPFLNIPYYFPSGMAINIGGRLVVGSNNILKFQDGTALDIDGTLVANANIGEFIYFTSYRDDNWGGDTNKDGTITAGSSGNWYGIRFQNPSDDANSLMRRCKVRYAGCGNTGGISTFDASPTIDSCDLSNNYIGVYMQYGSNPMFTNNTIGSSRMTPIAMSFEANPTMSNNILSFSDNAYDAIGLIGGTLTANATLKKRSVTNVENITYLILDQITIPSGKSLTINKGIVIKSYSNPWDYHRIIVEGTLTANATLDSMITFTSARDDNYGNPGDCNKDGTMTSPAIGDWGGIIFNLGGGGNLNYCRIKYAEVYNYGFTTCSTTEYVNEAAVAMIDASPSISNCEFKDLKYGISCYRASNPAISNNSMINIQYTPFNISGSSNPVFTGNTFTNVGWRALGLLGGNVCQNGTIKKRNVAGYTNITYVLLGDMTINSGTYVNVEPSVVIKVNNYYNGYNIFVDGGFKTDGIIGQKVVFTSIKDDNEGNPFDSNGDGNATTPATGDWGSIKYRSTSDDVYCLLNYTTIKYAGNTNEGGATFENAGGQLKNSTISNTSNYGVYCNGNSTPTIDNVIIQNCSLDPIAMSLTSNTTFTNITFVSNFSQAIKIIEGTLSSNATLASRNVAGITNISYIVNQLTISSNAKLTILPDVVIKFRGDNPFITVNGNLIANGTSSHKIYFTSFADDSKGGDANNNGNASSPDKGDWGQGYPTWYGTWSTYPGGIMFVNNSFNADTVNSLKYCEISYAGTGLRIENSHVTIDNCIIQLAKYFGVAVLGSANPDINNSQFYNITYSPIELSMFSNPTFTNCTALNVGYMALSVIPETYSQSATVPVRNFGGYTNISYFMEGACTINSGTTITIPAGVVFKSTSGIISGGLYYNGSGTIANGFIVNGRLNIQDATGNPVIFTNDKDDSYGNPLDMNQDGTASLPPDGINTSWSGNWISFNDVSDDSSTISNAIFRYGTMGITTLSASPTINNVRFENFYYGVDMNGVSAPKIDNCTFYNLQYYPMQISLVSYPASTSNNFISGTTYKVIKVKDETLTQDVTLPKRNFGGVTNIPYYFEKYTIGTGATLTINPGIVCKFKAKVDYWDSNIGWLDIFKGLSAIGGASRDSNIVFTSIRDDFYGGDSNSDSTATTAYINDWGWSFNSWGGLIFENESLDPLCKLKNCIIRFADKAIKTISASPAIENCNINNNYYGVYATAASNPVFSNCDFDDNYYFSINNVDKSFVIDAKNCWWGSNLGPIQSNTQGDGTSVQEIVTTSVDFTPWKTSGAGIPLMGDVSLNGSVQAYDASLILKYVVNPAQDTLNPLQQSVADVTGDGTISAYDASLILQYVVGMIGTFPANFSIKPTMDENLAKIIALQKNASAELKIGDAAVKTGEHVTIPISMENASGVTALQIVMRYDPALMQVKSACATGIAAGALFSYSVNKGEIHLALANTNVLNSSGVVAEISMDISNNVHGTVHTAIKPVQFLANEQDMSSSMKSANIQITGKPAQFELSQNYPNPFNPATTITYQLPNDGADVRITIYNILGQVVRTLVNEQKNAGVYSVVWDGKNDERIAVTSGVYIYQLKSGNFVQSKKLMMLK